MKKTNYILLLFLLCIQHLCFAQQADTSFSKVVDSLLKVNAKIYLPLIGNFQLSKQTSNSNNSKLEFKSATDFLVVKTYTQLDDSTAKTIVADKRFLIENLFKTQPSPYPDVVSNSVNCPDQFRPVPHDTANATMWRFAYTIYANDRFIFGECSDDAIFYSTAYIFIYNQKEKILNEIKYFTPKSKPVNKPEILIKSVHIL
jgi:hypothetical protein